MANFRKSTVREYFESIVIAVILALFVRTWVVQAFKIPTGSMENNLLIGDHLLVNKFVFGPEPSALERAVLPVRDIRRGDIVVFKYPGPAGARLHQARHRPARRDDRAAEQEGLRQRPRARRAVRPLPRDRARRVRDHVVRRARALRPGDGPAGPVLRDGRQSRQLAGQPLLGIPAAPLRQGQGPDDLLVLRGRDATTTRTTGWAPA